jgi:hypothetical protein
LFFYSTLPAKTGIDHDAVERNIE